MPKYLIMPEGCRWFETESSQTDLKTIYCLNCSFYLPKTRINIINLQTNQSAIFSREDESNGNLKRVIEHKRLMEVIT